jgi:hypothetical protein
MINPVALTLSCFLAAAAHQKIPAPIMWGLYSTEGGSIGSSSPNTDGSHDLGPMQINDLTWVKRIADLMFDGNQEIAREEIQWNGCFNAQVSAWIFHQYLNEDGGNLAMAVGHYNSHNPVSMARYQAIYEHKFLELYGVQLSQTTTGRPETPPKPTPNETELSPNQKPGINALFTGTLSTPH